MNGTGTQTLTAALAYLNAGLSVVPIKTDGSKRAEGTWKEYQEKRMSAKDAARIFANGVGVGVIGGEVSGNAEYIDIDNADVFNPFVGECQAVAPGLVEKLTLNKTPRGFHLAYRCSEVEGNQKLC